jgi:peptide/nickel transport system substrate-binding protein
LHDATDVALPVAESVDERFAVQAQCPSFLMLLASGVLRDLSLSRGAVADAAASIGTGPFKFVEFEPNQSIRVTSNPNYWKPGRPYLDGIDYTIIRNLSTALLAFIAGNLDMTWPCSVTLPLLKDIPSQTPEAICEAAPNNVSSNLVVNREAPPFQNPELRRAMACGRLRWKLTS